jgi:hypothetical protein
MEASVIQLDGRLSINQDVFPHRFAKPKLVVGPVSPPAQHPGFTIEDTSQMLMVEHEHQFINAYVIEAKLFTQQLLTGIIWNLANLDTTFVEVFLKEIGF